jgi:hypothetical protein
MPMMRVLLLALALALPAAAAAGQLYRWVDKDGTVRYSDLPPPAGTQSRTLNVPGSAPADSGGSSGAPSLKEREAAFEKRQQEQKKAAEKAAAEAQQQAIKEANCRQARESLAVLNTGQRIMQVDAQGNQYYPDDAQRAQETQKAQQAVREWCG